MCGKRDQPASYHQNFHSCNGRSIQRTKPVKNEVFADGKYLTGVRFADDVDSNISHGYGGSDENLEQREQEDRSKNTQRENKFNDTN